jgi:hypothetical protein
MPVHFYLFTIFFLEYAGELCIIVLIEENESKRRTPPLHTDQIKKRLKHWEQYWTTQDTSPEQPSQVL